MNDDSLMKKNDVVYGCVDRVVNETNLRIVAVMLCGLVFVSKIRLSLSSASRNTMDCPKRKAKNPPPPPPPPRVRCLRRVVV